MVDVAQPLEKHLQRMAFNASGLFTDQHMRDFMVSFPHLQPNALNYDFAPILGSALGAGNLTGGALATLTFTPANPCPWGLNGADANHWLYISSGTGTAEAVLVDGLGTAVEGGTSGTVRFIPANNHTGAWTVKSATGGIKECDIAGGINTTVYLKDHFFVTYAPIVLLAGSSIVGSSVNNCRIDRQYAGLGHTITISGAGGQVPECAHITLYSTVTVSAPWFGVLVDHAAGYVHHMNILSHWGVIWLDGATHAFLTDIRMAGYTRGVQVGAATVGIITGAAGPVITNLIGVTDQPGAVSVYMRSGLINLTNFDLQHYHLALGTDTVILFSPQTGEGAAESVISNGIIDGGGSTQLFLNPAAGAVVNGLLVSNVRFTGGAFSGRPVIVVNNSQGISFSNIEIASGGNAGNPSVQVLGSARIEFDGLKIGNLAAGTTAVKLGVGAASLACSVRNSSIGYDMLGAQDAGCAVAIDFGAVDNADLVLENNRLYGNTSRYANVPATQTRWRVTGNTPRVVTMASAATLALDLYDDGQVIELTGAVGVTVAVTGLREGQRGVFLATNAAGVAFSLVATVGKAFTALQNIPVPWVVYGGKLYATAYVS